MWDAFRLSYGFFLSSRRENPRPEKNLGRSSILPYDEFDLLKLKLAMKLGGKYRIRDISARSWEKLSEELRLDKKEVARRVREMASKLPVEAKAIQKRLAVLGMKHPVLDRLTERLSAHAEKCERSFAI